MLCFHRISPIFSIFSLLIFGSLALTAFNFFCTRDLVVYHQPSWISFPSTYYQTEFSNFLKLHSVYCSKKYCTLIYLLTSMYLVQNLQLYVSITLNIMWSFVHVILCSGLDLNTQSIR